MVVTAPFCPSGFSCLINCLLTVGTQLSSAPRSLLYNLMSRSLFLEKKKEQKSKTDTLMATEMFDRPASCAVTSFHPMSCRLSDSIHSCSDVGSVVSLEGTFRFAFQCIYMWISAPSPSSLQSQVIFPTLSAKTGRFISSSHLLLLFTTRSLLFLRGLRRIKGHHASLQSSYLYKISGSCYL